MACLIDARDLSYRYPDGREALRGVTLAVAHGERVAVLGPNGAGKTTFVYHLNGLLRGEGSLEVAGLQVDDSTVRRLRPRVGLVFQDPDDQLFMPTVREDVAFGPLNMGEKPEVIEARVDEALRTVRMEHAADRPPYQLSMGERRRVAIATVLAMRPQLLVLDEPTANLDPRGRRELLDVLTWPWRPSAGHDSLRVRPRASPWGFTFFARSAKKGAYGIRTRAAAVRGRCPRPLDECAAARIVAGSVS